MGAENTVTVVPIEFGGHRYHRGISLLGTTLRRSVKFRSNLVNRSHLVRKTNPPPP